MPAASRKPSLTRALELDTIRTDVLLSICALASRFYTDSKGAAVLVDSHFDREWAEAAGRMALRELESPKADNVVAFLNLALFWYSHGQFQRSNMLTGCASNTAWVIGVPFDEKSNGSLLDSEMQRRRFWACYLQCSFQADTLFPKIPTEGMLNIRLPCSESELQLGVPQSSITLKDADSTQSIYAELPHVRQRAISSVLASLKILQILGKDWAFLGVLGRFACGLYKVHASAPFPLTDEPKNMTPDALREFKPASSRARLSILTHNSIIISDQGSTAQAADDIGDLGLENADSREPGPAEENIAGFIAQMSREIGATSSQLPITIHPFLPSETVGSCALDGSFNEPTIGPDMDQFGHIDDFILDLMRQEGLLQQGAL
ncbi:hypothetical protein MW887_000438 [Aspergillus wentii]|nr:hypothetical protein MW887_000438 [Aspergillus wentii]